MSLLLTIAAIVNKNLPPSQRSPAGAEQNNADFCVIQVNWGMVSWHP
jgi:hypothetical protein